jgi:hypothetical protein
VEGNEDSGLKEGMHSLVGKRKVIHSKYEWVRDTA